LTFPQAYSLRRLNMSNPTFIGSISGSDGFDKCYVSFKELVAAKGAIVGTPTVVSTDLAAAVTSAPLLTFAGTINGITYAAGEMFTFKITAQAAINKEIVVLIDYESADKKGKASFIVDQEAVEQGAAN